MNYKEAWEELKNKLELASSNLHYLGSQKEHETIELNRLHVKQGGVELSLEYMREIESSIDKSQ
jgi:hypothetical protein